MHVKLSEQEKVQRFLDQGMPEHMARLLTMLEVKTAEGAESQVVSSDAIEKVTGRRAQTFDEWVGENRGVWM